MNNRSLALVGYALLGLVALALFVGGITGDTSDTGSGIGMAVFGALLASVAVSGLLGVLAGSSWHLAWAFAGLLFPGYSLPFLLYAAARASDDRATSRERPAAGGDAERGPAGASGLVAAERRERAAYLAELTERLRRLHGEASEDFRRLPAYESARRFLAEYEASGASDEAVALAEEAARETSEALSALVADVPDVGHRDSRGQQWARGVRLVNSARQERARPG